ncbi:hypothetical protein GCM10020000_09240 [Streptomyces olivoverticillatus]
MATPTITSISPTSGTTAGGNPVVITGVNFNTPAVTSVTFGGATATFTVNSDSQITATAPTHAVGAATVTVTNTSGSATTTYTYTIGPTLSPSQGQTGGGTTVNIYATNLTGATAVGFGTKLRPPRSPRSPGCRCKPSAPPAAGTVGVTVTTPGGTSGPANFYYLNPPISHRTDTHSGSTGRRHDSDDQRHQPGRRHHSDLRRHRRNHHREHGRFDHRHHPPAATTTGPAPIIVTTSGGTTDGLNFAYAATPTITTVLPATGSTVGGNTVTITGTGLGSTTQVTFGGTPANYQAASDTQLIVTTPTQAAGAVNVVVTSPGGSATAIGAFTYQTPPS